MESLGSTFEPTQNTDSTESSTIVEKVSDMAVVVQVFPVLSGEGTSKAAKAVSAELVVVILQELLPSVSKPYVLPHPKNVP